MPKDLLPLNFSLISNWKFEYIASSSEGTNFDLWVQNEDGHELFIEFKLTENEFGTAKSDARHLKKLNEIYEPKLRNKIAPEFLEPKEFFQHYQLLRNVSYSDSEIPASVIFLVPRENRSLAPSLSRIMAALTPETRSMVSICYLEDLVEALRFDGSNSDMSSYFTEYANKYLPEIHLNESR